MPAVRRSRNLSTVGTEALDSPALDPAVAGATLRDIAISNALFGGRRAVAYGVLQLVGRLDPERQLRVLDVGAGRGDVLADLRRRWARRGVTLAGLALDRHREAARLCRGHGLPAVVGDAFALPLRSGSVDVVVASQLLHHFTRAAALDLVREFTRVVRIGVVIADLRRTLAARIGIQLAARLLRFHPVSRADGVVSVDRGFTLGELRDLLHRAAVPAVVRRRPGFRLVAWWRSNHAHG
ncbi:MAG TPA: methyltransferase domain-containing protein [Gemmatimonadales bacterium]|nr:methyltransferase domain-containing protein [Gemmatimonadales bacterium]